MEVALTPDQEARLAQLAASSGTAAEKLAKAAVLRLLDEDGVFRAAVRQAVEQADRGELIAEAEMDARLARMLRS